LQYPIVTNGQTEEQKDRWKETAIGRTPRAWRWRVWKLGDPRPGVGCDPEKPSTGYKCYCYIW